LVTKEAKKGAKIFDPGTIAFYEQQIAVLKKKQQSKLFKNWR
jgi:hypothetical protein